MSSSFKKKRKTLVAFALCFGSLSICIERSETELIAQNTSELILLPLTAVTSSMYTRQKVLVAAVTWLPVHTTAKQPSHHFWSLKKYKDHKSRDIYGRRKIILSTSSHLYSDTARKCCFVSDYQCTIQNKMTVEQREHTEHNEACIHQHIHDVTRRHIRGAQNI